MHLINSFMIFCILGMVFFSAFYWMKKNKFTGKIYDAEEGNIDFLCSQVKKIIQEAINERPENLNLNYTETEKRKKTKARLGKSVRRCATGDLGAKTYVKDYIIKILEGQLRMSRRKENLYIHFDNSKKLTIQDKFEILLNHYYKKYGSSGLEKLIILNGLDKLREEHYEITKEDIEEVFEKENVELSYLDKLDILCQRIYSKNYGHGAPDVLIDMNVDGISGGVSGMTDEMFDYAEEFVLANVSSKREEDRKEEKNFSYNSIWISFQGKNIHLSFLGLGNRRELIRVCKNVYRVNNPGQLSQDKGYIVNDRKDGSRVVVVRPPFSDSWAFLIRKHRVGEFRHIEDVISDKNAYLPIKVLEYMVKGCQVFGITGSQNTGKTTLLRALIFYIPNTYNIRIQELINELFLRKTFDKKNVLTFRELPSVSGQEALDLQKKTDGSVNILGEVASYVVGSWIMSMSQVASLMTMFTHHAKTTDSFIRWFRTSLLKEGGFSNERAAEDEVVHALNFDVHLSITIEGHRYIERITEIIPKDQGERLYEAKEIIVFNESKKAYELVNRFSERAEREIMHYLRENERVEYFDFFRSKGGECL